MNILRMFLFSCLIIPSLKAGEKRETSQSDKVDQFLRDQLGCSFLGSSPLSEADKKALGNMIAFIHTRKIASAVQDVEMLDAEKN